MAAGALIGEGILHGPGKHGGKPPIKRHSPAPARRASAPDRNSRAPERTFEEVRYLRHLIDNAIPVRVRLSDSQEVAGTVEYYDHSFIRLTRLDAENLFIFKHDIKYLYEE